MLGSPLLLPHTQNCSGSLSIHSPPVCTARLTLWLTGLFLCPGSQPNEIPPKECEFQGQRFLAKARLSVPCLALPVFRLAS